jgi:hypothetical protein
VSPHGEDMPEGEAHRIKRERVRKTLTLISWFSNLISQLHEAMNDFTF